MPNVSDLLDAVRRVLGPRATVDPEREAAERSARGMTPPAPPVTYRPLSSAEAEYRRRLTEMPPMYPPYSAPVPFDPARNAVDVDLYNAMYSGEPPPSRPTTRPPAHPPTSTTTIGEPATIDADYAALVADLGLNSAAVDLERFKALVPDLGLHVYARAEVQEYLHHLYKIPIGDLTPSVVWGWRPLRAIDRVPGNPAQYNGRVQRSVEPYSKPIPYPVLLTVKAVRDACPSATFFVSDDLRGEGIPDPFLLVIVARQEFVIERWDEPAFRAKA